MHKEYRVVKEPASLKEFLGLPQDEYLNQPLEEEIYTRIREAKMKQRTGRGR